MLELLLCKRAVSLILKDISVENLSKEELEKLYASMNDVGKMLSADDIARERLKCITAIVLKYGHFETVNKIENLICSLRERRNDEEIKERTKSDMWLMMVALKTLKADAIKTCIPHLFDLLFIAFASYQNGSLTKERLEQLVSIKNSKDVLEKSVLSDEDALSYTQCSLFDEIDLVSEDCLHKSLEKRNITITSFNRTISKVATEDEFERFLFVLTDLMIEIGEPTAAGVLNMLVNNIIPKIKFAQPISKERDADQMTFQMTPIKR